MIYTKKTVSGVIVSVESNDKGAISKDFKECTKAEYDTYLNSLPPAKDIIKEKIIAVLREKGLIA